MRARTHTHTSLGRDTWRIELFGRVGVRATGARRLPLATRGGAHLRERHGHGHGEGLRQYTASNAAARRGQGRAGGAAGKRGASGERGGGGGAGGGGGT
jgi:hypothetical protein